VRRASEGSVMDVAPGLEGFARQFDAQVEAARPPGHEHAIHFCIALALGFHGRAA
jgi:hypothetical protein